MTIEILYFDGCPNYREAETRVREIVAELALHVRIVLVNVADNETASQVRFPGAPTIRIDGEDIDPGHTDGPYALKCRIYRSADGKLAGVPDRALIREALSRESS